MRSWGRRLRVKIEDRIIDCEPCVLLSAKATGWQRYSPVGRGLNDVAGTLESVLALDERREWYASGLLKAEPKSEDASDMATSTSISKPLGNGIDLSCLANCTARYSS